MSTLRATADQVVADLAGTGVPVVLGPPFQMPPAPPCYVVNLPRVSEVLYTGTGGCEVTQADLDVWCVPETATDVDGLLRLADLAIGALGGSVTDGGVEESPLADITAYLYRLTVEVP